MAKIKIPDEPTFTPRQVARIFAVSKSTLRRLMDEGLISHVRISRFIIRIPHDEVERIARDGLPCPGPVERS